MIPDSIRKRIAALNRGRLQIVPATQAESPVARAEPTYRASEPTRVRLRPGPPPGVSESIGIDEAIPQLKEAHLPGGCCGFLDRRMADFFPNGVAAFEARYLRCLRSLRHPWVAQLLTDRLRPLATVPPESLMYVDIEATGFTSGTPLFLVGTLVLEPGSGFRLRQYLARNYGEEGVVLSLFTEQLEAAGAVVSFNGKRYDLPYLRERADYHAVPFPFTQPHIDLLHEGRARFRHRLPNCKLQTLERMLCHRVRTGDIPGEDIPDAYHRFVRTGNALEMRDVVHHNALDLITLAEVMMHVLMEPPTASGGGGRSRDRVSAGSSR